MIKWLFRAMYAFRGEEDENMSIASLSSQVGAEELLSNHIDHLSTAYRRKEAEVEKLRSQLHALDQEHSNLGACSHVLAASMDEEHIHRRSKL